MIYPGEGKKGQPKAGDYVLAAERVRAEAAASPHQGTEFDLARADKWEEQARTKQLPSTRTEIGAGGELIDIKNSWDTLGVVAPGNGVAGLGNGTLTSHERICRKFEEQ